MGLEINTDDFWKDRQAQIEEWHKKLPKCGCGRVGRYGTPTGLACNKYMRCDNAEFLAAQIKSLTTERDKLKKELEKLLTVSVLASVDERFPLVFASAQEALKESA